VGGGVNQKEMMEKREVRDFLNFLEDIERLKRVPRSGWWYYGITDPESVADHSFGVISLAYTLATLLNESGTLERELDLLKILKMAILHELGETRIGDLQLEARKFLGEEQVENAERKVVEEITKDLGKLGEEIRNVYQEFIERKSPEAKFVHLVDKLELLMQATLYRKYGHRNLDLIFNGQRNIGERFSHPIVDEILDEIRKLGEK